MEMLEHMPMLISEGFAVSCLVVSGVGALVAAAKAIFNLIGRG